MPPAITIVLPTFQRAHLVGRAIDSVVQQRHEDWELVVVDDGSTDDTAGVLADRQDRRIVPIRLERNGGVSAARNVGLATARSPVVAFLDSDDVYLPDALGAFLRALDDHPEALAVEGLSVNGTGTSEGHQLAGRSRRDVIGHDAAPHVQTLAIRRDRGARLLFDRHLRSGEDRQFGLDLLDQGPIVGFDELVTRYLPQPDSLGQDPDVASCERFFALHAAEITSDPELLAQWYRRLAARSSMAGDIARVRSYLQLARRRFPRDPQTPVLLALSYVSQDPITLARGARRFVDPRRWAGHSRGPARRR
jgi:glycosyltransferase involved in cell wall biosynthesis